MFPILMPYSSYSNKSGIGGILKGLGLKGKSNSSKFNDSDSDLQISSEHTNREYKSRNPTVSVQNNNKKPPNRAGKCMYINWLVLSSIICFMCAYDMLFFISN